MMRAIRRTLGALVSVAVVMIVTLVGWGMLRGRPQDLPWTALDLGQPIGLFTGRKLAALGETPARCRTLLTSAGVRYTRLPPRRPVGTAQCGYDEAIRLAPGGARATAFSPAGLGVSCPVAAALSIWEWNVVAPAAQRLFGRRVTRIDHFGSYACRRMYGRDEGSWSEHATANAVDVAGFLLSDGTRISVVRDWNAATPDGDARKAAFLHAVRDGACGLFSTVLSPDYNAAHRDHLHLDQAPRGATGWRACR